MAPPGPRRLTLSAAEFALLLDGCAMSAPPGFGAPGVPAGDLRSAAATLADRGVVVVDRVDPLRYRPVPSVAANLAVLGAPAVTVRIEVSAGDRGLRAVYALSGPLGASLFARAGGAVELSLFPAVALGAELLRAVPAPDSAVAVRARVRDALGTGGGLGAGTDGDRDGEATLSGRLPLAVLAEYGPASRFGGSPDTAAAAGLTAAGLTADQAALAAQVERRTAGLLWCLITGRVDRRGGDLAVGEVVWLATDQGWVGLRPDPDPDGARMVALQPVDRTDLGAWIAPYLAQTLEAAA